MGPSKPTIQIILKIQKKKLRRLSNKKKQITIRISKVQKKKFGLKDSQVVWCTMSPTATPGLQPPYQKLGLPSFSCTSTSKGHHQNNHLPYVPCLPYLSTNRNKTYHPQRKIPELPRRQNPPRDQRPPQRYSNSVFEVNCITIDTEISHLIKTENGKERKVFKIQKHQKYHTYQKTQQPPSASTLSFWQAYVCYIMLMLLTQRSDATHEINRTEDLAKIVGPAQICGLTGHQRMYIALPDKLRCKFNDQRRNLFKRCSSPPFSR